MARFAYGAICPFSVSLFDGLQSQGYGPRPFLRELEYGRDDPPIETHPEIRPQ